MKTPLFNIEILSIYEKNGVRVLLPKKLAQATPDTRSAIIGIAKDLERAGGRLILSDLFRSYDMQFQAHLDWKTKKKKAFSPPPGGSLHEAGRAFDLSLEDLSVSLADFWEIAKKWNVLPIISTPNIRKSEAWHFDCRGSHSIVYDYYKSGKATNMNAYTAMAASAILAIGVKVDKFGNNQAEAYLQSCLVRLGFEIGNIDGLIGSKTRQALSDAEIQSNKLSDIILNIEDKLQEKYPKEIREIAEEDDSPFNFDAPGHIEN